MRNVGTRLVHKLIRSLLALGITATIPAVLATTVTFDFRYGSSALNGSPGNVRGFQSTDGSIDLNATGWGTTQRTDDTKLDPAWLGRYNQGLGVTNGDESGGSLTHTLDNIGGDEVVLFEFSETITPAKVYLSAYGSHQDSDISVWIGTFNDPYNNGLDLTDYRIGDLTSNGFTFVEHDWAGSSSTRVATINTGGLTGNALIIAASTADNTPEDQIKIRALSVDLPASGGSGVPDHGDTLTLALAALSLMSLVTHRRRPTPVQPCP